MLTMVKDSDELTVSIDWNGYGTKFGTLTVEMIDTLIARTIDMVPNAYVSIESHDDTLTVDIFRGKHWEYDVCITVALPMSECGYPFMVFN